MNLGIVLGNAAQSAVSTYKQISDQQLADSERKLKMAQNKATMDTMASLRGVQPATNPDGTPIVTGVAPDGTSTSLADAITARGGDGTKAFSNPADAQAYLNSLGPPVSATAKAPAQPAGALPIPASTPASPSAPAATPTGAIPTAAGAEAPTAPATPTPQAAPSAPSAPATGALPIPASSTPPPASPTTGALPASDQSAYSTPSPTAAPAPPAPAPMSTVYRDSTGALRVTNKTKVRTQDDVNQDRANIMLASTDPKTFAMGQELQNSILQSQKIKQDLQSGQIDLAAKQYGAAVVDARRTYMVDPQAGLGKLEAAYGGIENHSQVQVIPTDPKDPNAPVNLLISSNDTGRPAQILHFKNMDDLWGTAASLQDPATMEAHQRNAAQMAIEQQKADATTTQANAAARDAATNLLRAKTEQERVGVERTLAQATAGLTAAQTAAVKFETATKTAQYQTVHALQTRLIDPTTPPDEQAKIRGQIAALNGSIEGDTITTTANQDTFFHQAASGQTLLFSRVLKQPIPLNAPIVELEKDPDMQAGRIRLQQGQGYNWQYTIPGTPGGFSSLQEAKAHMPHASGKKQAIPLTATLGAEAGRPAGMAPY